MAWGSGGFKSCSALLDRVEKNDPKLTDLVILPIKNLCPSDVDRLACALESGKNTHLRTISASGHALSTESLSTLGLAISTQKSTGIRDIAIGDKNFGDEGAVAFCSVLESSHGGLLENVDLALKNLGKIGLSSLGKTFGPSRKLKILNLSRNDRIGDDGIDALISSAKAQLDDPSTLIFPSLEELNISECNIKDEGAKKLCQLFGIDVNGNVTRNDIQNRDAFFSLNMNSNHFGQNACHSFGLMCSRSIDGMSFLRFLSLQNCNIGDKELKAFLHGLKGSMCHGLQKLNLAENDITKEGAICLGDELARHCLSSLDDLNLANNCIGSEGVLGLTKGLGRIKSKQKLLSVDLSKTNCGVTGAIHTLELNSLSSLRLFDNNLGSTGLNAISLRLKGGHRSIKQLDLGGNRASGSSVARVLQSLIFKPNPDTNCLHTLEIGGNEVNDEVLAVIQELKSVRPEIDLAYNPPNTTFSQ
mmetsp:Transcript_15405/g.21983  ORF Transcript_15405/g.21983 Transcript_15405/m.21983 type:complete len:474 (-) Transcript_15405:72-1493(-)|eukprot:CAMPEP_0184864764 /NCGR_PEP_ID=MMETSP0580-20130426/16014_1 /TAXON_ID=1118495 /ORGANISM="Dactyliosolen fragilissimus" /LENGTH=473 /DNA_ID=CAMNT_0027363681 /DNA_START=60 /DNA_END=1481 /DNA_ORIENTATION=-